jgi:N-glycosylase/DNA lyase
VGGLVVAVGLQGDRVYFKTDADADEARALLQDYFNLSHDLEALYAAWSKDPHFKRQAAQFPGIRLLRQDPVETLFAFICSQNNGIGRITKMVQHLRRAYGQEVGAYKGIVLYSFPHPSRLAEDGVAEGLSEAGFGYRAKYIQASGKMLCEMGVEELRAWRAAPYGEVVEGLLRFPGIGPKVADCIALMSLDKHESVPVDTHIWRVACQHYKLIPNANKSMTRTVYREIGGRFRGIFGPLAGWAHLILFAAQKA